MSKKFDYKWVIITVSALMIFTVLGFCSSAGGMYIAPLTDALGISRSAYSTTSSLRYITTAVVNLFMGFFLLKLGEKRLILIGFTSLIASTVLFSLANGLALLYLGSLFLGIGLSFTTTTMVSIIINKWCADSKGTVLGLVLSMNGFGAAFARNILSPIINSQDRFGYRDAYRLTAIILLAVMGIIIIFFRSSPKSYIHKKELKTVQPHISKESTPTKSTLFLSLICIFLTGLVLQSVTGIADPHLKDRALSIDVITLVMSINAIVLSFSKFLIGFLYDKFGIRITSAICYTTSLLSMLALIFVENSGIGTAFALSYSIIVALALPLETVMLPLFARELFGTDGFERTIGIFVAVNTAGYALGGPIANLIFDITNSYNLWLIISILLITAIAITMLLILSKSKARKKSYMPSI